ncbi:hypothetical protein FUA24_19205 [Seonamhaeicola marinus]|uniref:DUF4097 domain-containing protein n=2 Tax=Seonamhaeicola marinus TaxID=1912246 RepID=A0A5D0HPN1_9FLAO|nr:hypothetical protein FUA24_19205 [Seonamhaeicola marinus]
MLPLLAMASPKLDGKYTKKKTINKEFTVNKNATLKVNSSYGNIDVITWDKNKTVFEITITTSGNDEEKVEERLRDITVDFSASPNLVSAETEFNKKSSSWWSWGKKSKVNVNIHYIVKIPISNNVDINNDYGSINLDKLEGSAEIRCDYGKITTKELMNDNNRLYFDYSQNCYFEYIKNGNINADYSGFTVSKTKSLNINADYSSSKVEVAETINYNCDYGSLKVENANYIKGNGDYLTAVFGDIYKEAYLKADYGAIKIGQLNENTKNVTINGSYTGIKIGFAPNYNFDFDLKLDYASLRESAGLEFTKKIKESTSSYYTGYHGNSSSGNLVKVTSDYGSISLTKN